MNKEELEKVIRLGLKTVGAVGKYWKLLKTNANEPQKLLCNKY